MAVWPDPMHGKYAYGHFKIFIFGKSDMFETTHMSFQCVLDYDFGSGLMNIVLWTMGSF